MISWSKFDRVMRDAEYKHSKKALSRDLEKVLKKHGCWKDNEPYCTYDHFTYTMTDKQIKDILDASRA
jgi:hypothetical protein